MFKVSAALPRLGLDACTMVADGRSLSSLPGDDEQLQLLEGSILAAVRLVVILEGKSVCRFDVVRTCSADVGS